MLRLRKLTPAGARVGGTEKGDRLDVTRVGREIHDPDTGKVIRRVEDPVGAIVITEVDESSAVGKFSGSGQPKTSRLGSTFTSVGQVYWQCLQKNFLRKNPSAAQTAAIAPHAK